MKVAVLLLVIGVAAFAQTKTQVDYPTQVKNGPMQSDAEQPNLATVCSSVPAGGAVSLTVTWNVSTNTTCNAQLVFNGGRIIPAGGVTVTLAAPIVAPPNAQIFDISSGGVVTLPSTAPAFFNWWGTNGAAVNAALSSGSLDVAGVCGTYALISAQITVPKGVNFDNPPCVTFTSMTAGVAILVNDPYRQHVSAKVLRLPPYAWPTGADTASVGVKIVSVTLGAENIFDFTITGFYTGLLLTTNGADVVDNLFKHVEMQDNKIALDHKPVGGNGVNQNNYIKFSARINGGSTCPGNVPIGGTKYIFLESGSDNQNTFINPELQNECVEHSLHVGTGVFSNQFYSPRLELNVAAAYYFEPGSFANITYSPFLDSGTYDPVVSDTGGQNMFYGTAGMILPMINGARPPMTITNSNGTVLALDAQGNLTTRRGVTAGSAVSGQTFNYTAPAPTLGTGFGAGATIVGQGAVGRVTVGTGAGTIGAVNFGANFTTQANCFAEDASAVTPLGTTGNSGAINIFSPMPFVAGHQIWFGCIGW